MGQGQAPQQVGGGLEFQQEEAFLLLQCCFISLSFSVWGSGLLALPMKDFLPCTVQ